MNLPISFRTNTRWSCRYSNFTSNAMICIGWRRCFYVRRLELRLTQGELAELYNLLTASTGRREAIYWLFSNYAFLLYYCSRLLIGCRLAECCVVFGDTVFKSNGLCAKMPEKSRNCLGSVNRAVDRVVCHPAALGWHRRATDDTLPGTELHWTTKLCFYQLSGQRPPPDCIGDKQEERGLLAPPLGNRDIYEERMGPTWCMDAGPRLLGNSTAQTIVWSWKCTASARQTLTWLLRRLS